MPHPQRLLWGRVAAHGCSTPWQGVLVAALLAVSDHYEVAFEFKYGRDHRAFLITLSPWFWGNPPLPAVYLPLILSVSGFLNLASSEDIGRPQLSLISCLRSIPTAPQMPPSPPWYCECLLSPTMGRVCFLVPRQFIFCWEECVTEYRKVHGRQERARLEADFRGAPKVCAGI